MADQLLTGAISGGATAQAEFFLTLQGAVSGTAGVSASWASQTLVGAVSGGATVEATFAGGGLSLQGSISVRSTVAGAPLAAGGPGGGSGSTTGELVLPYRCDWADPFEEERAYTTTIFEADDGNEQRRALRSIPARRWTFRVTAIGHDEVQQLENLLFADDGQDWWVPFWPHHTMLAATATAGATVIQCDTTDRDFVVDGKLLIWRSNQLWELATIQAVGTASVTLTAGLSQGWAADSSVAPCRQGALVEDLTYDRSWQSLGVQLSFRMRPGATREAGTAGAAITAMTVGVLPDGKGRSDQAHRNITIFETQTNGFSQRIKEKGRRYSFTYATLLDGLDEAASAWDWYNQQVGSLNPAYVPSYYEDLTLAAPVAPSDTAITAAATNFATYTFHPRKRALALVPTPGTVQVVQVDNVASVGNNEVLSLTTTAGVTLSAGVGLACFARTARLAQDAVVMKWHRPGLAEVAFPFVEIADPLAYTTTGPGGGGGNPPVASGDFRASGTGESSGYAYMEGGTAGPTYVIMTASAVADSYAIAHLTPITTDPRQRF